MSCANSVDPDQTLRTAASDLGLYCLPMSLLCDIGCKWVYTGIYKLQELITTQILWDLYFGHSQQCIDEVSAEIPLTKVQTPNARCMTSNACWGYISFTSVANTFVRVTLVNLEICLYFISGAVISIPDHVLIP